MRLLMKKLVKEALSACHFRGHNRMMVISNLKDSNYRVLECSDCGMEVYLNTMPMPNEINISGEAVALNCKEAI